MMTWAFMRSLPPLKLCIHDFCGSDVIHRSFMGADDGKLEGLEERQVARMWLSPRGAVSPLHYDSHMSILTQVCSLVMCFHQQSPSAPDLPVP